jgi:hypothetical protein
VPPILTAEDILNREGAFVEAAQAQWAEVDVPFSVIDLDEADPLALECLTDIDPAGVPADAAVVAHAAPLVVGRILERGQPAGIGPW